MSLLHKLPKIKMQSANRKGRGTGSGRGAKSTHGEKRRRHGKKIPIFFEGGQNKLTKKLALLRGKGKNKSVKEKPLTITLDALNTISSKSEVTVPMLIKYGLADQKALKVGAKILKVGNLDKALTVKVLTSKSAADAIIKAGGTVVTP